MIDTHCHLDYLKQAPLDEIITQSKGVGVSRLITISVAANNLDKVIELSKENKEVFCTQGIHPHDAKDFSSEVEKKIKRNTLENKKVVAIGEIGLDYYYDNSPREVQKKAFQKQLEIASELRKPVVIHTRDAEDDTISILKEHNKKISRKGVLHSFSSKLYLAEFAIENKFYLGFNGMVTFKKADLVREAVKLCPIEQILLETDAPFLTPMPHRGKENAPFYIPHIAQKIAEIKSITVEEVVEQTNKNSQSLFGI